MWCESHSVVSDSLHPHKLYNPWNSPGQNTGVGSGSLLQGLFPTQRSNPGFLHSRKILYQLSHQGSPKKLEWVAYPFSRGSSLPRNWTGVSCIAGGFLTSWATREARALPNSSSGSARWESYRIKVLPISCSMWDPCHGPRGSFTSKLNRRCSEPLPAWVFPASSWSGYVIRPQVIPRPCTVLPEAELHNALPALLPLRPSPLPTAPHRLNSTLRMGNLLQTTQIAH